MAKFFNEWNVTAINVAENLHLKSVLSMAYYDTIVIEDSKEAAEMKKEIEEKSKFTKDYKYLTVPSDGSANILFFNNNLVYPAVSDEVYKNLFENVNKISLENTEFKKIDGCLTCRSIFF